MNHYCNGTGNKVLVPVLVLQINIKKMPVTLVPVGIYKTKSTVPVPLPPVTKKGFVLVPVPYI